LILRIVGLGLVNAITIFLVFSMVADGIYPLAIVLGIVTIALDIIFLAPGLVPLRWIAPGMALMVVMVVYPILFTVYIAFTNYGDGHLLTEQRGRRISALAERSRWQRLSDRPSRASARRCER
jgi:K+-transporting ATPase c subunit